MKAKKFYNVRDMATGQWMINNVYRPVFTEEGHLWKNLGTLRAFFTNLKKVSRLDVSPLWEVVEYELQETERYPAPAMQTPKKKS